MQHSVIIIGGGAAGLTAARMLSAHGLAVTLLEASNRLGGRIHTITEGFTTGIEAGAEFIHGDVPETFALLKEAGIGYTRTGGKMYRNRNGQWVQDEDDDDYWGELMQRMYALAEDTTLKQFLQQYFAGEKYAALRSYVTSFAEGFDVADIARVSVFALRDEWGHEGTQYRVKGGYGPVMQYLANECNKHGCKLVMNAPVHRIDWRKNSGEVYAGEIRYAADKVIITVPVAMLQRESGVSGIKISPAVPAYTEAAGNIGYGSVVKVVFEFKTRFWESHIKQAGFIVSDEWMPVWWTQHPGPERTLTGWLGGPKTMALKKNSEAEILSKSLLSLGRIFGIDQETLAQEVTASAAFNWANNPQSLGAYSYATPLTTAALKVLTTPVENTLFFAGEAIYDGPHPGTVEAALVSGKTVAGKLLAGL